MEIGDDEWRDDWPVRPRSSFLLSLSHGHLPRSRRRGTIHVSCVVRGEEIRMPPGCVVTGLRARLSNEVVHRFARHLGDMVIGDTATGERSGMVLTRFYVPPGGEGKIR